MDTEKTFRMVTRRINTKIMIVFYTFRDSKGRTFPDSSRKLTWKNDFPTSVTTGEMKECLGLWHSLDPSSLKLFNSFQSCEYEETPSSSLSESCVIFPLVVSVDEGTSLGICSELPISRVLQYLVTREKKFKPIV
jgi:hypothetical protein